MRLSRFATLQRLPPTHQRQLELIVQGYRPDQIVLELSSTPKTVKTFNDQIRKFYFAPTMACAVYIAWRRKHLGDSNPAPTVGLSRHTTRALLGMCMGFRNPTTARCMRVPVSNMQYHNRSVLEAFNAKTREQAIHTAFMCGVLPIPKARIKELMNLEYLPPYSDFP